MKEDIDMLIFGCMYYLFLEFYIKKELGEDVMIISFVEEMVIELSIILQYKGILFDNLNLKYCFFIMGFVLLFEYIVE